MRGKRLAKNTVTSLLAQITTIICGFILPRLILQTFGSEINGLVNSVNQFLHIIAFMELGVGAVVQSSLYKPLADKDNETTSKIMASASKFFRWLGRILLVYVIVLMAIYPYIANQNFTHLYSALLIAAISISYFSQYYFGLANQMLLIADQRGYINYIAQIITLIANTILCVLVINLGASIQLVKLVTSLVYLLRPLFLQYYVNKHYQIDRKISYEGEPIKQKWNGIAQHVSSVVLDGTDNIVLTVLSTLSAVSIYSVYHLVVYGVKNLFTSMANGGIQSLLGELYAKKEEKKLLSAFSWTEWSLHTGASFLFACTGVLIVPFVSVYTKGITDAEYIQPLFAILIVSANCAHCLRLPYHIMIKAAGRYKETQNSYIIATVMNIIISVITVKMWGLIGVAIGTLTAMLYQTIWMAVYNSKHILRWPISKFLKQMLIDLVSIAGCYVACIPIQLHSITYKSWIFMAVECSLLCSAVFLIINIIFYRDKLVRFSGVIRERIVKR
ncbi:MAG: polysaccharide biosynthesis C-terminal domain-containing protein [Eubacterium sp.]|nr:polysaccharide biosynthesis C-terminal domain-containing protein [Eubacterium sp.]